MFTPRESNLKQGSSQSHRGAPSKVDSMVDKLYYGLRNIDFACLFADTASARQQVNKRLCGAFLFIHTQKLIQNTGAFERLFLAPDLALVEVGSGQHTAST